MIVKSTQANGSWLAWSLLGAWLAGVTLVVPAGAEEFSLSRCLSGGGVGRIDVSRHFACYEAQREYEASRYRQAAERQRATEEATRQQEAGAPTQETDRAAKARQEAERARNAEAAERARRAEAAERARKTAEDADAVRRTEALQEAQRRRAEQFMPGMCPLGDLSAKCAMASPDPVVEQIRRSQENAARGRPSR